MRALADTIRSPILALVGPPGVGKTSLGKSVARAMGRKFVRMSLGGIHDEAEIRGHRRTYIGALPGRVIQNIKTAGTNNPVFMLDEIDKIGMDFRGDPSSALLEVLDPEQNNTFQDNYLEVPFDLSKVLFIATGNLVDPIPAALRDRMEIIQLPGYTQQEKAEIGRRFLIPKQMENHGLKPKNIEITDEAMTELVQAYTHEAGVRNLEREIANIMRKVARSVAEGRKRKTVVDIKRLNQYLGPPRFEYGELETEDQTGAATGLVVTEVGGDIVAVEVTKMEGKEDFILTGQLGEVMRESARAALSWIRANADRLGIEREIFEKNTLHIHVPAGGIPKDGPSAGVTMATAMVSAFTGIPVRKDVAMTGEITLRGRVLPIGGLKSKILAAHLSGAKTVILPRKNEKDLRDIPEEIRKQTKLVLVDSMDQVLDAALRRRPKPLAPEVGRSGARWQRRAAPVAGRPSAVPTGRPAAGRRPARRRGALTGGPAWRSTTATTTRTWESPVTPPRPTSSAPIASSPGSITPIVKPGDTASERRFKEINEANEVLSDPDKRKRYDQVGANWEAYTRAAGATGGDPFGARQPVRRVRRPGRRRPLRVPHVGRRRLQRLLPDVLQRRRRRRRDDRRSRARPVGGVGRRIVVRRHPGRARSVRGAAAGRIARRVVPAGRGSGTTRRAERRGRGRADARGGLPRHVPARPGRRQTARGHGPARVETGSRIRLKGRGGGDPDHPADLYLVTRVKPHPVYTRIGADLTREVPITLGEALLGAEITVRTLKGRVRLTIPAGTQPGRTFRLKGQGMPRLKPKANEAPTGDLLAKIKVILPTDLSDDAKAAARTARRAGRPARPAKASANETMILIRTLSMMLISLRMSGAPHRSPIRTSTRSETDHAT